MKHSPQSFDVSNVCGQYSSMKLQHLSETLALTDDQKAKIVPTLEQEAGEVSEICYNPALSRDEKLKRYEKVVRASDEQVKPLLSTGQLQQTS